MGSVVCALAVLVSCTTTNPIAVATDIEQRAFAMYGSFVIAEEQGAKLATDSRVPLSVRVAIKRADNAAKPAADALLQVLKTYEEVAQSFKIGATTHSTLNTAADNLDAQIKVSQQNVAALVNAMKVSTTP